MILNSHPDIIGTFDAPPPTEKAIAAPAPAKMTVDKIPGTLRRESRHRRQKHDREEVLKIFNSSRLDCAKPSDENPGSEAKVLLMQERYAAGLPIFHPQDRDEHRNELLMSNLLAYLQDAPADDAEREDDEPDSDEFDLGGEG